MYLDVLTLRHCTSGYEISLARWETNHILPSHRCSAMKTHPAGDLSDVTSSRIFRNAWLKAHQWTETCNDYMQSLSKKKLNWSSFRDPYLKDPRCILDQTKSNHQKQQLQQLEGIVVRSASAAWDKVWWFTVSIIYNRNDAVIPMEEFSENLPIMQPYYTCCSIMLRSSLNHEIIRNTSNQEVININCDPA